MICAFICVSDDLESDENMKRRRGIYAAGIKVGGADLRAFLCRFCLCLLGELYNSIRSNAMCTGIVLICFI